MKCYWNILKLVNWPWCKYMIIDFFFFFSLKQNQQWRTGNTAAEQEKQSVSGIYRTAQTNCELIRKDVLFGPRNCSPTTSEVPQMSSVLYFYSQSKAQRLIYFGNIVHPSISIKEVWSIQWYSSCNMSAPAWTDMQWSCYFYFCLSNSCMQWPVIFSALQTRHRCFGCWLWHASDRKRSSTFSSDFGEYVSHFCVNAASEESIQLPLCEIFLGCGQKQYFSTNFSTVTTD